MFLLSQLTFHLILYAVLACVCLALHRHYLISNAALATNMRRDRLMGASFTLEQEAVGIMLLDLVQELWRDRPRNLNDVLNLVFQTLRSDGSLAFTCYMNLWVLAVMLGVYGAALVQPKISNPIAFNITVLDGSLDTILGDSSEKAPFITFQAPCAKDAFQRDYSTSITVLDGLLDGITVDSLDDSLGDLSDTQDSSSKTAQVVTCLRVVVPPRAKDSLQHEADCYAERKKNKFKDPSLERHRQESIFQKLKLKHVEDPEIARKKKLANIHEKLRKESKNPCCLNETELHSLRNNLKNRK